MKKIMFLFCTMLTLLSTSASSKTLVVYYSYTNYCREIVTTLTNQIQADVLEIQPAEKGLKYEADNYALGTQLLNAIKANPNDAGSYPAIDPVTTSLNDHETSSLPPSGGARWQPICKPTCSTMVHNWLARTSV